MPYCLLTVMIRDSDLVTRGHTATWGCGLGGFHQPYVSCKPGNSRQRQFRSLCSHIPLYYFRMWLWWISSTLCFLQARQQSSKAIQVSVQSHPIVLLEDVIVVDFIQLVLFSHCSRVITTRSLSWSPPLPSTLPTLQSNTAHVRWWGWVFLRADTPDKHHTHLLWSGSCTQGNRRCPVPVPGGWKPG